MKGDARRHRNAVEVANRQRRIPVNLGRYRRLLTRLVSATGRGPAVVGLTFVNDRQMHRLNRRYRRQNRPTDVLAFPSVRPPALGDIVISVDTARRQADGRLTDECRRLLIHGYLHLLGYDHERSPREARRMHRMERRLERRLA